MKKRRTLILILILAMIIGIFICRLLKTSTKESVRDFFAESNLELEWNLSLPENLEQTNCYEGESFSGDGARYYVYTFTDTDRSYLDDFFTVRISDIEGDFTSVTDALEVKKGDLPQFIEAYRWKMIKKEYAYLIIVYQEGGNKLFFARWSL